MSLNTGRLMAITVWLVRRWLSRERRLLHMQASMHVSGKVVRHMVVGTQILRSSRRDARVEAAFEEHWLEGFRWGRNRVARSSSRSPRPGQLLTK